MRRTVDLDAESETDLAEASALVKQKPAVVIRQALRAGIRVVAGQSQSARHSGYFTSNYGADKERSALESAMSKVRQKPER